MSDLMQISVPTDAEIRIELRKLGSRLVWDHFDRMWRATRPVSFLGGDIWSSPVVETAEHATFTEAMAWVKEIEGSGA